VSDTALPAETAECSIIDTHCALRRSMSETVIAEDNLEPAASDPEISGS